MEGAGTFAMNQLNAWKIGLLQVLITAYPVLTENGIKLQRPIALNRRRRKSYAVVVESALSVS